MIEVVKKIREVEGVTPENVFEHAKPEAGPAVFRGLANSWPVVSKGRQSAADCSDYLLDFYKGAQVTAFVSKTDIEGRIFYTDDLETTNFDQIKTSLDSLLAKILGYQADPTPLTVYMGSTAMDFCLPGLSDKNSLRSSTIKASVRVWLGNRSTVAAHYDVLENIACVAAGHRRFTLFPPDQLRNLYVGPIDFTPAGQPVSLVDLNNPDFERFPRFAEALEHALSAELEPGDAIYMPSMWWHHVEGLETFNLLINHWWRNSPAYMGAPGDALLHAILSLRGLPDEQRHAWRTIFEHYVFDVDRDITEQIPVDKHGVLGDLTEDDARRLRALLRNKLNQ